MTYLMSVYVLGVSNKSGECNRKIIVVNNDNDRVYDSN